MRVIYIYTYIYIFTYARENVSNLFDVERDRGTHSRTIDRFDAWTTISNLSDSAGSGITDRQSAINSRSLCDRFFFREQRKTLRQ